MQIWLAFGCGLFIGAGLMILIVGLMHMAHQGEVAHDQALAAPQPERLSKLRLVAAPRRTP